MLTCILSIDINTHDGVGTDVWHTIRDEIDELLDTYKYRKVLRTVWAVQMSVHSASELRGKLMSIAKKYETKADVLYALTEPVDKAKLFTNLPSGERGPIMGVGFIDVRA